MFSTVAARIKKETSVRTREPLVQSLHGEQAVEQDCYLTLPTKKPLVISIVLFTGYIVQYRKTGRREDNTFCQNSVFQSPLLYYLKTRPPTNSHTEDK